MPQVHGAIERRWPRSGFTIVELLVVLSIIAVILVIALPAVNGARDAALRNECCQRQVRLALVMARYNSQQGQIPAAQSILPLTSSTNPTLYTARTVGWPIHLLPLLERSDAYTALLNDKGWKDTATGQDYKLSEFACPAIGFSQDYYCWIHYFANCGTGANTGVGRNDGVLIGTAYPSTPPRSLEDVAIGDGTSNTLLFTEVYKNTGGGADYFEWNRDLNANLTPPPGQTVQSLFGQPKAFAFDTRSPFLGFRLSTPRTTPVINGGTHGDMTPLSRHAGGVVAVFCDGSSRFLHNSLSTYVYAHILTARSVWDGANYSNSATANTWLKSASAPQPYSYDPKDLGP